MPTEQREPRNYCPLCDKNTYTKKAWKKHKTSDGHYAEKFRTEFKQIIQNWVESKK